MYFIEIRNSHSFSKLSFQISTISFGIVKITEQMYMMTVSQKWSVAEVKKRKAEVVVTPLYWSTVLSLLLPAFL